MGWEEVHAEAEALEHAVSDRVLRGSPPSSASPSATRTATRSPPPGSRSTRPLPRSSKHLPVGARGRVVRVLDAEPELLAYLDAQGIALGDELEMLEPEPFGGSLRVTLGGRERSVGRLAARALRKVRVSVRKLTMTPPEADSLALQATPSRSRTPLERLLARGRLRATLAMLGPAFVAAIAYVDPGNFATNVPGRRPVRLPAALGRAHGQPHGHAGAVPVGQARHRHRPQPARAGPRALPARAHRRPLAAGRSDGDGHRRRRVHGRGARPEPALRRAAAGGRPDHRRHRVRHPRAAASRLSPLRAGHHRPARHHLARLPLRDAAHQPAGQGLARRPRPAPRRQQSLSCWRSASSARPSCRTPSTCTRR